MNAQIQKLEQILFSASTKRVEIPKYQRPYSWGQKNIEEFWEDVIDKTPTYFLGPIITIEKFDLERENQDDEDNSNENNKPKKIEVVDGQQRLITSTLLATVLRDLYKELGDHDKSKLIQQRFISFQTDDGDDSYFRLNLGLSSKEFFKINIQSKESKPYNSQTSTSEHKLLIDNYKELRKKVDEYLDENTSNSEKRIEKIGWIRDRLKNLKVIQISIDENDDAYEIFERINNYGVDLTLADLLKNHVLKNLNNQVDLASSNWRDIEKNIDDSGSEMKKFIRYHWLSKYAFESEKKLYSTIKEESIIYDKFLEELLNSSEYYKLILDPQENEFADLTINTNSSRNFGKNFYKTVKATSIMKVSQVNVLYLSLIRNIKKGKINYNPKNDLINLERFIFRYHAICSLPANKSEKLFSKYAIKIEKACNNDELSERNRRIELENIFKGLKDDLKDISPSKDYFLEEFIKLKYQAKTRPILKYIFQGIDSTLSSSNEYILDFDEINIEHFLPQDPSNWSLSKAEIKEYVNSIGNLLLVDRRINGRMGNKALDEKIEIMKDSELNTNKEFINSLEENGKIWTEVEINTRANNLAKESFKIWK